MIDNPYPAPAPNVVADMCAMHAWSDHIDDHTRKLLEWSADTIRIMAQRLVVQARSRELIEADRDNLLTLIDRRLSDGGA